MWKQKHSLFHEIFLTTVLWTTRMQSALQRLQKKLTLEIPNFKLSLFFNFSTKWFLVWYPKIYLPTKPNILAKKKKTLILGDFKLSRVSIWNTNVKRIFPTEIGWRQNFQTNIIFIFMRFVADQNVRKHFLWKLGSRGGANVYYFSSLKILISSILNFNYTN